MGRPERPIPPASATKAVGRLAAHLRQGRRQTLYPQHGTLKKGLPYAELAKRTAYSASTLQRAASGRCIPPHRVVRAYATACGLDLDEVDRLWHDARRQERRGHHARTAPVAPALVRDEADLAAALAGLHEHSGAPSIRLMAKRARLGGGVPLSRSTIQRTVARQRVPASRAELETFLMACQVPEDQRPTWVLAWHRARRQRAADLAAAERPLKELEAKAADSPTGRISGQRAVALAEAAGFVPLERYRRFTAPWTVRCAACGAVRRVRLSGLVQGPPGHECDAPGHDRAGGRRGEGVRYADQAGPVSG